MYHAYSQLYGSRGKWRYSHYSEGQNNFTSQTSSAEAMDLVAVAAAVIAKYILTVKGTGHSREC